MAAFITITSQVEYEQAIARIHELQGALEGTPEEAELASLEAAVNEWSRSFDDDAGGNALQEPNE